MKASDYVARFMAEGCTIEAFARVIVDMIVEVRDVGLTRRIIMDGALFSIFDEMDIKFKSFRRQTGGKLSDGSLMHKEAFRRMLRQKTPDIFNAWNRGRGGRLLVD
ncbi:MAG: hypothetical protein US35_C0026G0006 [Parcubacteria group bacterium GW2011_GWA2_37_10]|nr:MAG: hypothetical protein US35_C0026G0006 [Parcubacteria group bacterium GW2011_GWA2_37_10]